MQDKENVTIIIATHNNAKTIERAINSITRCTRPANQIIIGDNDSTDGTYEVLCNLLDAKQVDIDEKTGLPPQFDGKINDTEVKIFRKRLTTTGHTINTAMQMKWQGATMFGYMEPTSWYADDKITQAIEVFGSHKSIACIVSDCDDHHSDGRVERIFRSSFDMQRILSKYSYDRNFLIRPQIFPKLKSGFNEQMPIRDDYDFLLRVSEIGLIYHIPASLHNNTVLSLDQSAKDLIQQCENNARQMAIQRRTPSNV